MNYHHPDSGLIIDRTQEVQKLQDEVSRLRRQNKYLAGLVALIRKLTDDVSDTASEKPKPE